MEKEDKIEFYQRGFLNSNGRGVASYEMEVDNGERYVSAQFRVSDCNRKVALDFDCWDKADLKNARDKISTLRAALEEFENQFNLAVNKVGRFEPKEETKVEE